jgi:rhamnose utilization protein RhaD (predicted bifunctional aldolase and dehydrogenase)
MVDPAARPPSIETLLHAFLPARHVDHVHADAICALTNHRAGRAAVAEALGADVAYVPYIRPGFDLSVQVAALAEASAVVLEHHGLVTWADTHEGSLGRTLDLDAAARRYLDAHGRLRTPPERPTLPDRAVRALLATLRGALGTADAPVVLHVDRTQRYLADRDDVAAVAAGRGTPDHLLRIGVRSLVVADAAEVEPAVAAFEAAHRDYVARNAHDDDGPTPPLRSLPWIVLVPGLGCVAAGRTPRAARMHAEIAHRSHRVTAMARDAFGEVRWLSDGDVYAFDTWPLELRKLALAPAPPPLTGRVVVVIGTGAARGAIGDRLAAGGANVASTVAEAVEAFGGLDAVVAIEDRAATAVSQATDVWRAQGRPGAVVAVGRGIEPPTAGQEAARSVISTADPAAAADLVALLLSPAADRLECSELRVRGG